MKNFYYVAFLIALFAYSLSSCKKDKKSDGLSSEIHNMVPQSIINAMKDNGMPIYEGTTPPNLEGAYLVSPFILVSTSVPDDQIDPGYEFSDYYVNFYDQDNVNLSVKMDIEQGDSYGSGFGCFISGSGNKFSIFTKMKTYTYAMDDSCANIQVISGETSEDGLKDLFCSIYMVDNYGNVNDAWIPVGTGRVAMDEDGLSEYIQLAKSSRRIETTKPRKNFLMKN